MVSAYLPAVKYHEGVPSTPALTGDAGPATDPVGDGGKPTRERILDIALELFSEQGYDKTSLREIAEQLGYSKAAVYYHFASKDDILLALHYRLHGLTEDSLLELVEHASDPRVWADVLTRFLDKMMANRQLFVLHERNRAALETLHREGHPERHEDMADAFRSVLANPAIPVRDRVRLSCALGAVMGGLMSADAFTELPTEEYVDVLRQVVDELLVPNG
jgi:AcrR family transcriptional regulator